MAASLKQQLDRAPSMKDRELNDLKADVKVIVAVESIL